MGSRIQITLAAVLANPNIDVRIEWSDVTDSRIAEVRIHKGEGDDRHMIAAYRFDYSIGYAERPTLEADFNLFRYGPNDPQMQMMRQLYEQCINFTIVH